MKKNWILTLKELGPFLEYNHYANRTSKTDQSTVYTVKEQCFFIRKWNKLRNNWQLL